MNGISSLVAVNAVIAGLSVCSMSGCSTLQPDPTGDSRTAHTVRCDGSRNGWEDCLAEVRKYCGAGGYEELHRDDDGPDARRVSMGADGFEAPRVAVPTRSLTVACKSR